MDVEPIHPASPALAANVTVRSTDVFVAGGGPAGLACAIALAQKGFKVLVADGMKPPIDKACGEGLMPDTLAALEKLGINLAALSVPHRHASLRGIRFLNTVGTETRTKAVAQASFPAAEGRGIKRKLLHQLLLDRAKELGVGFTWETAVRGITGQGTAVQTNRGPFAARFIIGADGHRSRIRTCAGLDQSTNTTRRIALRQHFATRPWSDFVEVYWSNHGQAYVTPVGPEEVCIAFVSRQRFAAGVHEALSRFPQLRDRLSGALPSDGPRGSVTYSCRLHRVTRGNIALVGDASGSVDSVTGEGLSLAFRQALALADAIQHNDLAAYEFAHETMGRLPHLMARSLLLLDRSALLRTCSIAMLQRFPGLFSCLLKMHIRHAAAPSAANTVFTSSQQAQRLEPSPEEDGFSLAG